MPDQGDWEVDAEGNLTPPGEKPPTDEFGRDDPAAIERERRRREREQRRKGGGGRKAAGGGKRGLGRRRKQEPPPPAAPDPAGPTAEQPQPPRRRRRPNPDSPAPEAGESIGQRAAASHAALRNRFSLGRGDGGGNGGETPAGPGHYRRRRTIALALAAGGVLALWFLIAFFQPFAGDGQGEGSVTVEIPEGASASEIADVLDEAGVISSGQLFEWRLKLAGKSGDVQADSYTLASGMSYGSAIDALTGEGGPSGPVTVSIGEGYDRQQIADLVLPEGVSSDEYLQMTEMAPKGFNPAQYGAKSRSLEGFLYPATYELPVDEAQRVPSLINQQLQAFQDNIAKVDMSYAQKKNLTAYDVLTIASMIDKEVMKKEEAPLVAAVIYNRLNQGIPLGIDATTRFETGNYDEQIPQSDLEANTPYNTRLNAGLTPTPIGNPGLAAIKAAAAPAKVDFLYFVVKPGTCGEHSFTASEAEFEKLAAEYQAALEAEGGSPTEC